jgi:anti-sigma B factor antagonist
MFSSDEPFAARVVHQDGSLVVRLSGELDIATVPQLRQLIGELVDPHLRAVTLDMEDLRFVDVTGLRTISEAVQAAAAVDAKVQLRAVSLFVQKVIRIVRFKDLDKAIGNSAADLN